MRGPQESKSICEYFGGSLLTIYEAQKVLTDIANVSPGVDKDFRIDAHYENNSWLDSDGRNLTLAVNAFVNNDSAVYEESCTLTINPSAGSNRYAYVFAA